MDKNRLVLVIAQTVMFVTLAVLVGLGHDSLITDGMMVISGSLMGTGAWQLVKGVKTPSDD